LLQVEVVQDSQDSTQEPAVVAAVEGLELVQHN
jgi:hypothetical protein